MTKRDLIHSIRFVLGQRMGVSHLAESCDDTKLNQELYLDSVLILQLFLHLELECGLKIPEQALMQTQFGTVGELADYLLGFTVVKSLPIDCEGAA
jgi:acyl carrier protein